MLVILTYSCMPLTLIFTALALILELLFSRDNQFSLILLGVAN